MANTYEVRAQKFIQQIFPFLDDLTDKFMVNEGVWAFNYTHKRKVRVSSGLTRIALITSDYVVKFDYDKEQIRTFGGCEDEMEIYDEAEADGFEYLFAKITPYKYEGYTFYIMPRIKGVGRGFDDAWEYLTDAETDWLCEHRVADLHCHNFGWRNGHVCLIDYGCRL